MTAAPGPRCGILGRAARSGYGEVMTGTRGAEVRRRIRTVLGNPWFKAGATLAVLGFILFWLRGQMPFFAEGFEAVARPQWGWIAAALVFSYLSMSSYGSVQKVLLRSAG